MVHFAAVFAGVVMPGLLWKRVNGKGALVGFGIGVVLALVGLSKLVNIYEKY